MPDEPRCACPAVPSLAPSAGVASPNTTKQQTAPASKATAIECTSPAANVVVRPHPTPPGLGNEIAASAASAVSSVSVASNVSTCASAHESTSIASDEQDTAGASVLEATVDNGEGLVLDCIQSRSKRGNIVRSATLSRGTFGRAGSKGVGRKAAKGEDGSSLSRVPALHGELMLLDGCLHDHKVRTWVETTLVPAKKRAA